MTAHLVLTSIGADRPGLVDEVARFIFERGGNLEDSRMVNLHRQFAMVMLVAADEAAARRGRGPGRPGPRPLRAASGARRRVRG